MHSSDGPVVDDRAKSSVTSTRSSFPIVSLTRGFPLRVACCCACRWAQLVGIMEELLEVTAAAPDAPLDVDALSAKLKFMANVKANYVDDA